MSEYIVQLEQGCWIADWDGDPGRTIKIDNAERFSTVGDAAKALKAARKFRPFSFAIIVEPSAPQCSRCSGLGYVEEIGVSVMDIRYCPCPECCKRERDLGVKAGDCW